MKNVRSVLKFHLLCFNILFFYVLIYYYCCKWRSTSSLRLNEDGMQLENGKETKMKAPMTLISSMPPYIFDNTDLHAHTAGVPHSRTICIVWCILRLLWPTKSNSKSSTTLLGFWLHSGISWICKWGIKHCSFWSRGFKVMRS